MVPRGLILGLSSSLCLVLGCDRLSGGDERRPPGASSSAVLDGMQLESARRVGLETAKGAMARRDLPRLKQLSGWVRGRAQVPLFEPDDLKSLDLAIQCLEQVAPVEALASFDQIKTGTLRDPARAVCASRPAP